MVGFKDQRSGNLRVAIAAIIAVHTCLLCWGAMRQSATVDEPAHLASGMCHWRSQSFELYRVNPPLIRLWASIVPALNRNLVLPTYSSTHQRFREEFWKGEELFRRNGETARHALVQSRLWTIPWSWVGALSCYSWAAYLGGSMSGIVALMFWCFSPNVLAHAQLITPDLGSASLGIATCYCFGRWLDETVDHARATPVTGSNSSAKAKCWVIATGSTLGLAVLAKSTFILLFALWPILTLLTIVLNRAHPMRVTVQLAVILLLAGLVLNAGYGFEGTGTKLRNIEFVSEALSGQSSGQLNNRFHESWIGDVSLPVPVNFVRGIDQQKYDFERQPGSYLCGEWRKKGWWWYYVYALLIKTPVAFQLMLAVGIISLIYHTSSHSPGLLVLFSSPLAIMILLSSQTGMNHHVRYALPVLPFGFIVAARGISNKIRPRFLTICFCASWGLVGMSISSSLSCFPHTLSYFNEWVGGPRNGPFHLIDSNVDWGQDRRFALEKLRVARHRDAGLVTSLIYSGAVGIYDYHLDVVNDSVTDATRSQDSSFPNPAPDRKRQLIAVSVNHLFGMPGLIPTSRGPWLVPDQELLDELRSREPDGYGGYSIWIFSRE